MLYYNDNFLGIVAYFAGFESEINAYSSLAVFKMSLTFFIFSLNVL